jgi:hypothetical protein
MKNNDLVKATRKLLIKREFYVENLLSDLRMVEFDTFWAFINERMINSSISEAGRKLDNFIK